MFPEQLRLHGSRPVPHGRFIIISTSQDVGDDRGYYVYTPPGYDPREASVSLLYCCTDSAMTRRLTAVAANVILDNLIAQSKAKPMLCDAAGYGAPEVLLPNSGVFRDRSLTDRNSIIREP